MSQKRGKIKEHLTIVSQDLGTNHIRLGAIKFVMVSFWTRGLSLHLHEDEKPLPDPSITLRRSKRRENL